MMTTKAFTVLHTLGKHPEGMRAGDLQEAVEHAFDTSITALYMRMKRFEQDGLVTRTYVESRRAKARKRGAPTEVLYTLTRSGAVEVNRTIELFDVPHLQENR
jgi:DNA-binding PadR family transcriptional regulator